MRTTLSTTMLARAIRCFEGRKVLVYGDLLLDEYVFGRADRLSPEKPVPVVMFERRDLYPGGAGNVARNLQALGCEVILVALVGDDEAGRACREYMEQDGLSTAGLVTERGRRTPHKRRVHAGQHALLRIDYEDPEGGTRESYGAIDRVLGEHAADCDAAIVSDYRKGTVTDEGMAALVAALGDAPCVVDPKGGDPERYRGATFLLPNEHELDALLGHPWDDAGADSLRRRLGLEGLVLTRSERGVRIFTGEEPLVIPARARQVYDVTGAGDTFAAHFTAFKAAGESVEMAARLANTAAGLKVQKVGTATVTRAEVAAELARTAAGAEKRIDLETARAVADERRAQGERIVFTNGCFDLLHAGHIKYLEASRRLGDCLFVGLNTDESVRRLKGAGRPILDTTERAEILSALSCVDHVVMFEGDTPIELIEAVRPDVLTKGADYEIGDVVGGDRVVAWGGKVELIDLVAGKSTTRIIDRISELLKD